MLEDAVQPGNGHCQARVHRSAKAPVEIDHHDVLYDRHLTGEY